ncbi:MAG: hypothetical protein R2838_10090 [Caldilineaceae bacterium]
MSINIDELTVGQLKEIQALIGGTTQHWIAKPAHPYVGQYCIVRCYGAGVHAGIVQSVDDKNVILSEASRIWQWKGAFTLTNVAKNGVTGGRVAGPLESIALTDAIEIIPATRKCRESLEALHE